MIKSLEKRKKSQQRWKEMEEEEYGKGGYLRQVTSSAQQNAQKTVETEAKSL